MKFKAKYPKILCEGEIQFDAAWVPNIARDKIPDTIIEGKANVFIFPNLDAGNIGYKIAQRMGNYYAWGPLLQGLKKPVNDLSRGCSIDDIINIASITSFVVITLPFSIDFTISFVLTITPNSFKYLSALQPKQLLIY